MFVQCMYTVYGVLFSPLWLKSVPGWPIWQFMSVHDNTFMFGK